MPRQILSISYDEALLSTRELLLKGRGYEVISALGFTAALKSCNSAAGFDLFILGHSIPHTDKEALIEAFRGRCRAPILALDGHGEPPVSGADFNIDASNPSELLKVVDQIVSGTAKAA